MELDRLGLALLLLLPLSASAQEVEREQLAIVGWNNACSVAVNHLGFPFRGQAIYEDPVVTRIGTLTLAAGASKVVTKWEADWSGSNSWRPEEAKLLLSKYLAAGYTDRGYPETIRPARIAPGRGLEEIILSTATLGIRGAVDWPGPPWRLARIHYNRLSNCALVVFDDRRGEHALYRYVLTRVYNTAARPERARAHLTNGLLLFNEGELIGAKEETGIAASTYPQGALNHYHYAAMLANSGEVEQAMAELREAVAQREELRKKAAEDRDFENLRDIPAFKDLVKPAKKAR